MNANDYFSIQKLIFSYAYLIDKGDLSRMSSLFSRADVYFPDGQVCSADPLMVEKAFADFVRIYPDGTPRTRHLTSNVIIDPAGDNQATASSYVMVFQQTDELALQPIIGGDYHDEFSKDGDHWYFTKRVIGNDLFGDLGVHGKYSFKPIGSTS